MLKVREKDDCIPIATEPLPKKVQALVESLLPEFEPLFRVAYEPWTTSVTEQDPLQLFLLLFTEFYLQTIVDATNIYTLAFT